MHFNYLAPVSCFSLDFPSWRTTREATVVNGLMTANSLYLLKWQATFSTPPFFCSHIFTLINL